MKSFLKITVFTLVIGFISIACDTQPSLQKYFVESKENDQFMSIDLPASILQLKNNEVSNEVKNTLETIKKINFLALQITDSNKDFYTSQKKEVQKILKNPKYKQLMRMNINNVNVSINYLGEETAINEVIIFGADNEKGFAIARVIGNKMNPSEIIKLTQEIKLDGDSNEFQQLQSLFTSIK
jgi:hypothetical protein